MRFIILVTCYNCQEYIAKCISSIKSQSFRNYQCFILNDLSTDDSVSVASKQIGEDSRFQIITNKSKLYQVGNYQQIVESSLVLDEDIIVELDGDDWFMDSEVLYKVYHAYEKTKCLMTHGSMVFCDQQDSNSYRLDTEKRFNRPITSISSLRSEKMFLFHLRTWKAKLQRLIPDEYHRDSQGQYYSTGGDASLFIPMAELAGLERIIFIPDILVGYNCFNPIQDYKKDATLQKSLQVEMMSKYSFTQHQF